MVKIININEKYSMLDFEMIGKNLKINFSKHLTKKEKRFFRFLQVQKYRHIKLEIMFEILGFSNLEDVISFLNNLKGKYIILSSKEKNYYIYLSIIQSFYINKNIIYIVFSDEISSSFKKGSFFENIGLNYLLFLDEKFSYRVYHYICNSTEKTIYLSIDELREILEIDDSYKRFYDLEKNFLIPIFEDIRINASRNFSYEKEKSGDYKGAKILGITIYNNDITQEVVNNKQCLPIDKCMDKIKKYIKNFSDIYSLISLNISIYGEDLVNKKIDFVLNNFNSNIEEHIKNIFSDKKFNAPCFVVNKKFKSLFELHSEILSFINKHDLTKVSTYMFLVKLYSLKDKESLLLEDKNFAAKITYNKNSISTIEFFINSNNM